MTIQDVSYASFRFDPPSDFRMVQDMSRDGIPAQSGPSKLPRLGSPWA